MMDIKKEMIKVMLEGCNRKINEFNEISEYLSQYSQAVSYIIPLKYQETVTNCLEEMKKEQSIIYQIEENPQYNVMNLLIFNFGVMERENLLTDLKNKMEY